MGEDHITEGRQEGDEGQEVSYDVLRTDLQRQL